MNRTATIVLAALAATTLVACDNAASPSAAATPAAEASPVPVAPAAEASPAAVTPAADAVVVTLAVDGMHCDGCAAGVEAALVKLDGVRSCAVSFDEKSARVELDAPERTDAIIAAIEGLGYTVAPAG